MKKALALLLAAIMALTAIAAIPVSADERSGDWGYKVSNGNATINRYYGSAATVTIPSTIDGYPVTGLSRWYDNDSVNYEYCGIFYGTPTTGVTIPDSVTSIGTEAFYSCTSLTSVTIPNSVTTIGSSAFLGCTSLTSVTIGNSVTSIGSSAFEGCTSLTSVTIPDSVTVIDIWAFGGCSSLTSVIIPDSVTTIGGGAFEGCTSLSNLTIGNSVTLIDGGTFSGCASLTDVTIPDGVTSIGQIAFSGCTSLTSVTIPDSVTTIDAGSFNGCSSLNTVKYTGTQKNWDSIVNNPLRFYSNIVFHCLQPHDYTAIVVKPTCTSGGYTEHYCSLCYESYFVDEVPALGHDFGEWTTTTPAVCTRTGTETRYCSRCDATERRTVPALGHAWSEWRVFVAPSCAESGYEFRVCLNDGSHIEIRAVEATGHALSHVAASAAGCETAGNIEYWKCDKCGKCFADAAAATQIDPQSTVVAATGHAWSDWCVLIAPTVKECGVEFRFCLNDGKHAEYIATAAAEEILAGAGSDGHVEFRSVAKLTLSPGDLSGDGNLNAKDVLALMRLLTGWADDGTLAEAADFNGDGRVNVRDVFDLMKSIVE